MNQQIKTVNNLPPEIKQIFSYHLLAEAKIGDSLESMIESYIYILNKLNHKVNNDPKRLQKFEEAKKEFLEVYERAKTKEKNLEATATVKTKRPLYFIEGLNKRDENLFKRLRSKRRPILF